MGPRRRLLEEVNPGRLTSWKTSTGRSQSWKNGYWKKYFLIDFEAPPTTVSAVTNHLGRDIDVIRSTVLKHQVAKIEECVGMVPVNYENKLMTKTK